MNKDRVREINVQSKKEKWPFPKTFAELKAAGIAGYRYDVPTGETVYMGTNGLPFSEPLDHIDRVDVAPALDEAAVAAAIKRHMTERTPFSDFRGEAARAGVLCWEVSMDSHTVTYIGEDEATHVEQVPL